MFLSFRANAVGPFFLRFPNLGTFQGADFGIERKTRTLQNSMGACFQNKTLRVQGRACRACRATVSFRHHTSLKAHLKWPPRAIRVVIFLLTASPVPGQHVLRIRRTCCPGFPGHQTRESTRGVLKLTHRWGSPGMPKAYLSPGVTSRPASGSGSAR